MHTAIFQCIYIAQFFILTLDAVELGGQQIEKGISLVFNTLESNYIKFQHIRIRLHWAEITLAVSALHWWVASSC